MIRSARFLTLLSAAVLPLASCANAETGESTAEATAAQTPFAIREVAEFQEPWAMAFAPGTPVLFVTEKAGTLKFIDTKTGTIGTVSGVPAVDYGGQGGLGDVAFLPTQSKAMVSDRTIYLSFAEAGENDTRGAAVGKGTLVCGSPTSCEIRDFAVIWRQSPKVTGRGHYSHRLLFSPDGQYLYVASGERQKGKPSQDTGATLGKVVRLNIDGTPAAGNPMADKGGVTAEIWSYGHRNILGIDWDSQGRLWEVEHGPAGGDELNLVKPGANYGWPVRSNGDHYNGDNIPDHTADDGFAQPALSWSPVIAPGDMLFYSGAMFKGWQGRALIAGLGSQALVEVVLDGESAREVTRYEFDNRLRALAQGPDGTLWVAEDGKDAKLLALTAP
ncbi:PQQ-dependent sugar dehydrogenase [Erythrobacter sp. BLCC-B19]|uniref:PQQ-dependent sugar dehydrogenase n=1 Tax=Erythrobacter sp. BLCC-B19 TaxID=3025315 RepID=UPI002360398C|nr:PQQ-dependent sugar dehydrogenase [Erythrobacter sp. BLCC-B19]WDA40047.1 PQQ-dependent sugar dehydrogenase [Erythrobacter sp. BLCC-B19]